MTPPENTAKISDPRDAKRAENIREGRVTNHLVPGWDAKADDAEDLELVCPNPACEQTLDTKDGVATLVCPYCGTNYTAPTSGFTSDVIRDQNLAANQADPNRDNFETVAANQARSQATPKPEPRSEPKPPARDSGPGAGASVKL